MTRALALKIAAGATAGLAAGAALVFVLTGGSGSAAASWIDDPLHGSRLALGAVEVVAHAADPDGVAAVELAVDDVVAVTQDVSNGPTLATVRFNWTATIPGAAELLVRARDGGGDWGAPARVTVYFGESRLPTVTTSPSPSPSVAVSASPSPRPSAPPPVQTTPAAPPPCTSVVAVGLVSPADGFTVGSVSPVLRWSYNGPCPVGGYTVEVSTERDFSRVTRSSTTAGGILTWQVSPGLVDCQRYYWRVQASLGGTMGPWSAVHSFVVGVGPCT